MVRMASTPEGSGDTPVPPVSPPQFVEAQRIIRGYGIVPSSPQRPPLIWGVDLSSSAYHRQLQRRRKPQRRRTFAADMADLKAALHAFALAFVDSFRRH